MDISNMLGSSFLKPADVAAPRRAVISELRRNKWDKLDCEFQDGTVLSLNATNLRALANAWSSETNRWIGKEVELRAGTTRFNERNVESVLVQPISPALSLAERQKPPANQSLGRELNDEIPF